MVAMESYRGFSILKERKMYYVIETKTGYKMSHTTSNGCTIVFMTHDEARAWICDKKLNITHEVIHCG